MGAGTGSGQVGGRACAIVHWVHRFVGRQVAHGTGQLSAHGVGTDSRYAIMGFAQALSIKQAPQLGQQFFFSFCHTPLGLLPCLSTTLTCRLACVETHCSPYNPYRYTNVHGVCASPYMYTRGSYMSGLRSSLSYLQQHRHQF